MAVVNGSFANSGTSLAMPYIEYSYTTDITAGTYTITAALRLKKTGNSGLWINSQTIYFNIAGEQISPSGKIDLRNLSVGSSQTLATMTKTVSNRTGNSMNIQMQATMYTTVSNYGTGTVNGNPSFPAIPMASTISNYSGRMGESGTISVTRANSNFTHTIQYKFGSESGTIVSNTTNTSISWTPPKSLANQIPNNAYGVGTLYCYTYSNGTHIGTSTATLTLNIPYDGNPKLNQIVVESIDNAVPSAWGVYVQGISGVKVTIQGNDCIMMYGTSLAGATTKFSTGYTSSNYVTIVNSILTSGKIDISSQIIDKRGYVSSWVNKSINVCEYVNPSIGNVSFERCNSDGTLNTDGTYVLANITGIISSCDNHNTQTITVKLKKSTVTDWEYTYTVQSGQATVIGSGNIDVNSVYNVHIEQKDAFNTSTNDNFYISTSYSTIELLKGGRGVSFGKAATLEDTFECDMDAQFNKRIIQNGVDVIGNIIASKTGSDNAFCVKLSNGIMLQWGITYRDVAITHAYGNVYFGYGGSFDFPIAFMGDINPSVQISLEDNNNTSAVYNLLTLKGWGQTYIYDVINRSSYQSKIRWFAIGRWK